MGLLDILFGTNNESNDEGGWNVPPVSEEHFGRDRFGYYKDEEDMYSDDERYDSDDNW